MRIIDLTLPFYTGMAVYPGDTEASIELIQTLEKDGWNMRRLQINSHDGTHVNVPIHGIQNGKTLDDYDISAFMGPAKIFKVGLEIDSDTGVVFRDENIDMSALELILKVKPHFVALSARFEVDIEIEKVLLANDIMLFERLANTEDLPDEFYFYGAPLKIKDGDGSPVRAFAIVD
jgi:arylformamidase